MWRTFRHVAKGHDTHHAHSLETPGSFRSKTTNLFIISVGELQFSGGFSANPSLNLKHGWPGNASVEKLSRFVIWLCLPVCGAAFQQKGSAPAGTRGACPAPPHGPELSQAGNGPWGSAGGSWCLLAVTAPTPLTLVRGEEMGRVHPRVVWNLSDLPGKTALLHLGSDRHNKTTEFSNWLSRTGKRLPSTNKLLQHCLLFHFSWHFLLIQLGLAPVEKRRRGTTSSSELAIPASLLLGQ